MLVAACLLASSLLTCEWHRPGTQPRLRAKPIEVAALPEAGYPAFPDTKPRLSAKPIEVAALPEAGYAAFPDPDYAAPQAIEFPAAQYNDSVMDRMRAADPVPERFARLAYLMPSPAIYGDYPDLLADTDIPEKQRKGRKTKREVLAEIGKPKSRKTRAAVSEESLAYAVPAERDGWLSTLFGGGLSDGSGPKDEPSSRGSGYDAVRAAARKYGPGGRKFEKLAQDITFTESRGRCGAVSSAKALGVMQTKYGTARMMGYKGTAEGLKNCRTGAEWGVKYLAYCHDLAKGDIKLTSVCYNQGHGVLTNPDKYGKLAERKEAVNYVATMRSRGWRM